MNYEQGGEGTAREIGGRVGGHFRDTNARPKRSPCERKKLGDKRGGNRAESRDGTKGITIISHYRCEKGRPERGSGKVKERGTLKRKSREKEKKKERRK